MALSPLHTKRPADYNTGFSCGNCADDGSAQFAKDDCNAGRYWQNGETTRAIKG